MTKYNENEGKILLKLARDSLEYGLWFKSPLSPKKENYPQTLQTLGASFITLNQEGKLRGCIGSLERKKPLIEDISYNAYMAGFKDPRFNPLMRTELSIINIHISVLNDAEEIEHDTEEEIFEILRPNIDGLIIEDKNHCATFLPSVWRTITNSKEFIAQLKLKAGLNSGYYSSDLVFKRYTVEDFSDD